MTATDGTPTLAFYPRIVTPCPTCDGNGMLHPAENYDGNGPSWVLCGCSGGWRELPAVVKCEPIEPAEIYHDCRRCGNMWGGLDVPDCYPAPWALALPGDEVLVEFEDGYEGILTVGVLEGIDHNHQTGETEYSVHAITGHQYEQLPVWALARVLRPGSDWELERGRVGLGFQG